MSDKKRSKRSQRRLRLSVAKRMALVDSTEPSHDLDIPGPSTSGSQLPSELPQPLQLINYPDDLQDLDDPIELRLPDFGSPWDSNDELSTISSGDDNLLSEDEILSESDAVTVESGSDVGGLTSDIDEPTVVNALYSGSLVSTKDFEVVLMSIAQRHNLTYSCQDDLLKLVSAVLPSPSNVASSSYVLRRQFFKLEEHCSVHYFCSKCFTALTCDELCKMPGCVDGPRVANSQYLQLSLSKQLQQHFQDPEFVESLQYRFKRTADVDVLSDIYDGAEYEKNSAFFSEMFNVSCTMNFDGGPKFKSSCVSIWPIQLYLNELPPHMRLSKQYMFLGGLWCSSKKPPVVTVVEPTIKELRVLEEEGVQLRTEKYGEITCRVKLLTSIDDLPAKAALTNCNQYNGAYGCATCLHEGETVAVGRGSARVYGYRADVRLRNHADHLRHAEEAERLKKPVFGVKGLSVFHSLPSFDIVNQLPVDYMHCVLLGVVRRLLSLWFDPKYHLHEWYIGRAVKVKEVDQRLSSIKPPHFITRLPRSVATRKHWKATECRTFLFYYLHTTLQGILPDKYLFHTLLLSKGIRILLGDSFSHSDCDLAEQLLCLFWKLQEQYYGLQQCTINVHMLSHLPHFVRLYGPLWTQSAFAFEDCMGQLVSLAHGTQRIGHQIVTSFLTRQCVERQAKTMEVITLKDVLHSVTSKNKSNVTSLTSTIAGIGKVHHSALDHETVAILQHLPASCRNDKCSVVGSPIQIYAKLCINGRTFYSKISKRHNSTMVTLQAVHAPYNVEYGQIQKFIVCPSSTVDAHIAIVQVLNTECFKNYDKLNIPVELELQDGTIPLLAADLVCVLGVRETIAIPVESILNICFDISVNDICVLCAVIGVEKAV